MKKILIATLVMLYAAGSMAQPKAPQKVDALSQALAVKAQMEAKVVKGLPIISKTFRKGDAPGHVEVDLTGLDELVLVTWATPDGNDFDHAVWADAKLVDKDGKATWLSDVTFKYKKIGGDWFRLKTNFSGEKFVIGGKKYTDGVLAHADGLLVVDLKDKGYTKFISDMGIDNGSTVKGSAVFKVLSTSGRDQAQALLKACPEVGEQLVPFIGTTLENWLTTPGTALERAAVEKVVHQISNRAYFDKQIARIEALTDKRKQIEEYVALTKKGVDVLNVQAQMEWLNPEALVKAFNDFKGTKRYDLAKYQAKVDEFLKLTKGGLLGVYSLEPQAVADATRALALKREIMLSNPVLDIDKIIVTRYKMGEKARYAGAQDMGTQPSNWSCQLSGARSGFDAQIVELSNLRGEKVHQRSIFKPNNDGVVTDVQLHWDADKMMFTANDAKGSFQVYEVGVDGSGYKQVTNVSDSDLEFFDAAYLPNGKIVVASNLGYAGVPCVNGSDAVASYSLMDPKTSDVRRLTFDQDNNWNATVLRNGKVMYTRWEYTDLMHYYSRIVFHMNPDGTEQKALFGSGAMFPNSTFDMQQLLGNTNRFIGVISGHHGVVRSGRLIIFDPTKARKGVEGMIQELPYSQRPIIPLVKDELVTGVYPQFIKPHPLTDNYFLVTAKLTPNSLWGVYLIDVFDNLTLIAEYEGEGLINPIPLAKRITPAVIPDKVPMKIADCPKDATVFIQDIYEGEGLPGVPRGTIKELRVLSYEFAYLRSLSDHVNNGVQSGWDIKRELGRVPVNADGSATFTIPANMPISLQPLDSTGAAVQLMRSWFVGMPGETVSCVGCHEDQNQIAMPKRTMASQMKPLKMTVPEGGARPYTFENEIQPLLDRACIACHNTENAAAGIDYTKGRMYELSDWAGTRRYSKSYLAFHPYFYRQGPEAEMAVLNPYEYNVANSEMIQMLRDGHHGVQLTDKEWNRLITWVDFNLPYGGVFIAEPFVAQDGHTYDQMKRRIELSTKYSGAPVNWQQELEDYTAYIATQPKVETTMPMQKIEAAPKNIKAKGWPFSPEMAAQMVAGKEKKEVDLGNGQSMTFVYIPAGTYVAGANNKAQTMAQQKVVIKKGFWMAEKEVSNAQMRALVPTHDSRYIGQQWKDHTTPGYLVDSDYFAATKISFNEAMLFNDLLSKKSGLNVTLPTEQQWEWAARSGSASEFWFGNLNTDYASYENLADQQLNKMAVSGIDPQPMGKNDPWYVLQAYIPKDKGVDDGHMLMTAPGTYKVSPWGLYDINGNVAEWTRTDMAGTDNKVVRGGSWYDRAKKATAANRRGFLPWHKVWNVGFRPIIEE